MIDRLLTSQSQQDFRAATRALDRLLTAGRYAIPIYQWNVTRIAHDRSLHYPETMPIFGDWPGWLPDVWWWEAEGWTAPGSVWPGLATCARCPARIARGHAPCPFQHGRPRSGPSRRRPRQGGPGGARPRAGLPLVLRPAGERGARRRHRAARGRADHRRSGPLAAGRHARLSRGLPRLPRGGPGAGTDIAAPYPPRDHRDCRHARPGPRHRGRWHRPARSRRPGHSRRATRRLARAAARRLRHGRTGPAM